MKKILTYCVLLCGVALTAGAVNYPTYRPTGNFTPVEYRSVIENGTPMLEMRSTSQYGEQLEGEWGLYNPFTDEYESPERASSSARRAPGTIGAAYDNFLKSLPSTRVEGGVTYYDQDVAAGYWGSTDMPTMVSWLGFLAWFDAQENVAWEEKDVPIGDGLWLLLLCALAYAGVRSYYKYRTIEDRKIEL